MLYPEYYAKHGADRNDLLGNAEVVFQTFAIDIANIAALRRLDLDRSSAKVLDVGCGGGTSLLQFIRLGFDAGNLSGVDTSAERIEQARHLLPAVELRVESADHLAYPDGTFDLVFESTMLGTLSSDVLLKGIAREMIRVTRRGGYVMLADWRYSRRGSGVETAMSKKRIAELFDVGRSTSVVARHRGALVPPVGRRLSRLLPSLYFLVQALVPPAVGQMTTVLRKS
ncbi:MAG: class I SAM-dependent methyltransferase [Gemmatimonadales bacterium]